MERKLASIQKILSLTPIPGADKIETATVLGWQVIVKKDLHKVGDLCCFFEIDSLIQFNNPAFEFLRKNPEQLNYRLKTIRLRKQLSQGLIMPVNVLPNLVVSELQEGQDVTEALGITKWEPVVPDHLIGKVRAMFPNWIPKTDEMRIQTCPEVLEQYRNYLFVATEKLDGTSITMYLKNDVFYVCSRNMDLYEIEGNAYWKAARAGDWEEKMRVYQQRRPELTNFAFQGELIGNGIQGNKYQLDDLQIRLFNIFDGQNHSDCVCMDPIVKELEIPCAPLIVEPEPLVYTVDEILEKAKGQSALCVTTTREGLVWRPVIAIRDDKFGRLSFKTINNDFLEQHGE